jgi:hypothetical protein
MDKSFRLDLLNKEVAKFKELIIEATFFSSRLILLLFGYLIKTAEIINTDTRLGGINSCHPFYSEICSIKKYQNTVVSIAFVARGLITILLFLSITPNQTIDLVNKSLIIQVILLTAIIMMVGLMVTAKKGKCFK